MPEPLPLDQVLNLVYIVDLASARDWRQLDEVLAGGVSAIWLRAPGATGADLFAAARDLKRRCDPLGAALIVGDRADVARAVGTPYVQLGMRSPPPRFVAGWFSGRLGVSCHSERDLWRAADAGAAYAVLSPIFGVPDKGAPLGVEKFRRLVAEAPLPVVGLGGIEAANVDAIRSTSAIGVAAIRSLRDTTQPRAVARRLAESNVRAG